MTFSSSSSVLEDRPGSNSGWMGTVGMSRFRFFSFSTMFRRAFPTLARNRRSIGPETPLVEAREQLPGQEL